MQYYITKKLRTTKTFLFLKPHDQLHINYELQLQCRTFRFCNHNNKSFHLIETKTFPIACLEKKKHLANYDGTFR